MGIQTPADPARPGGITLTYQEFLDAIDRMPGIDFPGAFALRGG
jgi:hypothetical protein